MPCINITRLKCICTKKIGYYYAVKANNEIILTRMVQGDKHDPDIV